MAGLVSPDVPALACYLVVTVAGFFVARAHVNERLKDYPDHWAFLSAWLLLLAYWGIPPLLFWFLDYTGAVQDTSLFAALLVAFGYRQLFVGGVKGLNMPGQASGIWKPFQAWVDTVAERINDRQGRYIDRFTEHLRSHVTRDPAKLDKLEILALQRTKKLTELRQAIAEAKRIPEEPVARSRLFDRLWPDLKTSAPNEYGYLLHENGLVSSSRRWWSLERGRAKAVTGASLVGVVLLAVGAWLWALHDPRGTTVWETAQRRTSGGSSRPTRRSGTAGGRASTSPASCAWPPRSRCRSRPRHGCRATGRSRRRRRLGGRWPRRRAKKTKPARRQRSLARRSRRRRLSMWRSGPCRPTRWCGRSSGNCATRRSRAARSTRSCDS